MTIDETITMDEAIKRLTRVVNADPDAWEKPDDDAIKLGIEALKNVKFWRESGVLFPDFLLPGETKD